MWRRIRVYFVGLLLGCLLTWMLLLRNRNMDDYLQWTPNQRVLTEFNSDTTFILTDNVLCYLKCYGFKSNDYKNLLKAGKVLFTESNPRKIPKMYRIAYETEKRGELIIDFEIDESEKKKVIQLTKKEDTTSCDCPTL